MNRHHDGSIPPPVPLSEANADEAEVLAQGLRPKVQVLRCANA